MEICIKMKLDRGNKLLILLINSSIAIFYKGNKADAYNLYKGNTQLHFICVFFISHILYFESGPFYDITFEALYRKL